MTQAQVVGVGGPAGFRSRGLDSPRRADRNGALSSPTGRTHMETVRYHCPICGLTTVATLRGHQCNPKRLAAIDRAHRGADLEPGQLDPATRRSYSDRLKTGFLMRSLTERDD